VVTFKGTVHWEDFYHLDFGDHVRVVCYRRGVYSLRGVVEKAEYSNLFICGRRSCEGACVLDRDL
jgi:hypothetical protein